MNTYINRAGLLALAAALAACQATAAGSIAPATPSAAPSASTAPSAAPFAAPSAAPTAAPTPGAPMPGAFEGVVSFQGAAASGWKLAIADAATGAAIAPRTTEVLPVAGDQLVVYLGASTTDAKGNFTLRVANLGEGDALRVTATAPDGKSQVATLFTSTDLEVAADDGDYRLLHAGHHAVDEVSTAVEALQRGPLRAMAGLPADKRRSLLAALRDGTNALKAKLEEAFKQKPALGASDLTKPGSDDDALDRSLMACLDAAGVGTDAAGVVGKAVAAIQQAIGDEGEGKGRKAVGETFLLGTSLTISLDAGGTALKLVDKRTGKAVQPADAAKAGAVRKPSGGSGGGGSSSSAAMAVTLKFAGMMGDQAIVTSGQALKDGAPTYAGVGSDARTARVMDLRFFIHDVALIDGNDKSHDLKLAKGDWQYEDLALIDLDQGTTDETNDQVTGTVPAGTYKAVTFKLGVPADLDHLGPTRGSGKNDAPHEILAWDGQHGSGMGWSWLLGHKYAKIELGVQDGDAEKKLYFHLGGQGATNPTRADETAGYDDFDPAQNAFEKPNVAAIEVGLDPTKDTIAVDLKAFFANVIVAGGGSFMPVAMDMPMFRLQDMGMGNAPDVLVKNLGLQGGGGQKLFRKKGE